MHHTLITNASTGGHLGWLYLLTFVKRMAISTDMEVSLHYGIYLNICPEGLQLSHILLQFLIC